MESTIEDLLQKAALYNIGSYDNTKQQIYVLAEIATQLKSISKSLERTSEPVVVQYTYPYYVPHAAVHSRDLYPRWNSDVLNK